MSSSARSCVCEVADVLVITGDVFDREAGDERPRDAASKRGVDVDQDPARSGM